jgi:hypothetical protein
MTDPIYCHAQTPFEPREFCTNEVADHGDLCARHDEDDRADELYDAWVESRYED